MYGRSVMTNITESRNGKAYEIFTSRYGAYPNFEVRNNPFMIDCIGTAMQQQMVAGKTTITLTVDFHHGGFNNFMDDMIHLHDIRKEEYLRHNNPTLQRAYDEYQILLKLSK